MLNAGIAKLRKAILGNSVSDAGADSLLKCTGSERKHTPIVSDKQRGLFGAELARRKKGKKSHMKGITDKELSSHLKESAGKDLPAHKGIEVLRDMAKGITGAERAGHKYIGRMPRAGGGYIYEYAESEAQQKSIDTLPPGMAAKIHAQTQRVSPEAWRKTVMMTPYSTWDEKNFRYELKAKTESWGGATRQYDSQRSMGMTASSHTRKAAQSLGKQVKEMQALLDKAEATEKQTQNKVGNMTNKGIEMLRDMNKALRGSEKPGHKYTKRTAVAGGGYHYVYDAKTGSITREPGFLPGATSDEIRKFLRRKESRPEEIAATRAILEPIVEVAPESKTGAELDDAAHTHYSLKTNSQDELARLCDEVGVDMDANGVTGAICTDTAAGFGDVWLTESARPFDPAARYFRPAYFNLPAKKSPLPGIAKLRAVVGGKTISLKRQALH